MFLLSGAQHGLLAERAGFGPGEGTRGDKHKARRLLLWP